MAFQCEVFFLSDNILFPCIHLLTSSEVFYCDFEDPRSPMCSFRIKFPQRSLDHREEQWDVRRAAETRSPGGIDGPVADQTLDSAQGELINTILSNGLSVRLLVHLSECLILLAQTLEEQQLMILLFWHVYLL